MRISDWSSDVCSSDLDHHGPPTEGDRRDSGGGVSANAGQFQEPGFAVREAPGMLARHAPRTRDEVAGTGIVTEARPGGHDIALVGRRQRFDRGPAAGERLEIGRGMRPGRLLEHELGEPNAVRAEKNTTTIHDLMR